MPWIVIYYRELESADSDSRSVEYLMKSSNDKTFCQKIARQHGQPTQKVLHGLTSDHFSWSAAKCKESA